MVLLLACASIVGCRKKPEPANEAAFESKQERAADVREAFSDPTLTPATQDENAEIDQLFTDLGKAFVNQDKEAIRRHFDFAMFAGLMQKRGLVPAELLTLNLDLGKVIGDKLSENMAAQPHFYGYERHRLRKLNMFPGGNEGVAFVQHWDADGIAEKSRWWIVKKEGRWRAYDFESIDFGMRYTTMMGIGMQAGRDDAPWAQKLADITAINEALMQGDFEAAHASLESLAGTEFPTEIEAMIRLMESAIMQGLERYEDSFVAAQAALGKRDDLYLAQFLMMDAKIGQEKYKEALEYGEMYIKNLGGDADIYYAFARAQAGLENTESMLSYLTKALADDPMHLEALAMYTAKLPSDRKSEALPYFRGVDTAEKLDVLAEWLADYEDPDASALLVEFRKSKDAP